MRAFTTAVSLFVLVAGLTACDSTTTEPIAAVPMEVAVRTISGPFSVGVGRTVDPSDAELFGVQYGYPTASTSVGEDGEFEIFLWLGEYELRPYSQMGGERATARFSGNLTVRPAAREASVTFGMPQVAFHVLEGLIHCSEFGQCWSTPGRSLAWGKTEAAETVFTTGRFAGLVAGDSLSWRLVRAGVVLAGKCNSSRLDRYMVVETSGISVSRQNVWPEDVRDQFVPNFYAEVVCRRQAIAAARGM